MTCPDLVDTSALPLHGILCSRGPIYRQLLKFRDACVFGQGKPVGIKAHEEETKLLLCSIYSMVDEYYYVFGGLGRRDFIAKAFSV